MCLAVPGKVLATGTNAQGMLMGQVAFGGISKEICLAFLPEVKVGDYVIVHAGVALSLVDEEEAAATLDLLRDAGAAIAGPAKGSGDAVR